VETDGLMGVEPTNPQTLTRDDLPALMAQLEAQGWQVSRRGDTLNCLPGQQRTKAPKPPSRRLLKRVLADPAIAEWMERFDAQVLEVEDLKPK
jgi:hypothetical protein